MPFQITMPQLGLTMEKGSVVQWLVEEGEPFRQGQEILEVETDKATVAVEAHQAGTLVRVLTPAGHEAAVGAVIGLAVAPGEKLTEDVKLDEPVPERSEAEQPDTPSKRVAPEPRPRGAVAASWKARTMAREAGLDLPTLSGSGPNGRIVAADVAQAVEQMGAAEAVARPEISPVAANLAAELRLDPSTIAGSGPEGRVMRSDVIRQAASSIQRAAAAAPAPSAAPVGAVQTIPLAGVRGTVSERMANSASTTARVTLFREVDADALTDVRERFSAHGHEVSYNDLLICICARALREHPEANARMGEGQIEYLDRINIGLAVDTERGLLVPVVHDADRLSVPQVSAATTRLIEQAQSGQLGPDDLAGGTFTITNLGMLGVDRFTPVINLPECCILGVGRVVRKPVVAEDGESITVRPRVSLSLAFDHRVIDGAPAARFLDRLATLVEDPTLLL